MKRWVLVRAIKNLWYQFWRDSHHLPRETWRRWLGTLAIGLGVCAVVMFALTVVVKHAVAQGNLQDWDEKTLIQFTHALPLNFSRAITWESPGNLLGMLPIVIGFVSITILRSHPLLAATMMAAYGLQFSLVWIGWGYWNRDRPDLIASGVAASGLHSFPSGHTVVVITVYGLLAYLWGRTSRSWVERLLILVLAVLWIGMVASARLVLGAHWPTDVIIGGIVGSLWLAVVITALTRAESVMAKSGKRLWGDGGKI